jgi:hypothetical protein
VEIALFASTRLKRLRQHAISFAIRKRRFRKFASQFAQRAKPKGAPCEAPLASRAVPLAGKKPASKNHSE